MYVYVYVYRTTYKEQYGTVRNIYCWNTQVRIVLLECSKYMTASVFFVCLFVCLLRATLKVIGIGY